MRKKLLITGIRGIPARHGGFETFAEKLALYLSDLDWDVTVYCQSEDQDQDKEITVWGGIRLIRFRERSSGAFGTILFDIDTIRDAIGRDGVILTLGYNTAILNFPFLLRGRKQAINMDGIEWKRRKWGRVAKVWLYVNERLACWIATRLIADHPEIARHLRTRVSDNKISMIPYGSEAISRSPMDSEILSRYGLLEDGYALMIARPEPENQFLEIVRSYSRTFRKWRLVILGNFSPDTNGYHAEVINSASEQIVFLGAIYTPNIVNSLRANCAFYVHGHTVGGTNPSLVEALGSGCAIVAASNDFNKWVCGNSALYFDSENDLSNLLTNLEADLQTLSKLRKAAKERHKEQFTWDLVLSDYRSLLENLM